MTASTGTHARKYRNGHDTHRNVRSIRMTLRKMTREARHAAGNVVAQYYGEIMGGSANIHKKIAGYVGKRPLKSLGLAMLAGLVVGFIARRR